MRQFELGQYKDLNVKRFDTSAGENDINRAIDYILNSFDEIEEEKRNEPIEKGDYVIIDIEAMEKGTSVPVIRDFGSKFRVGSDDVLQEITTNLLGKKMGDTVNFETVIQPDAFEFQRLWGCMITFSIKIKSVLIEKKPELTKEFIQRIEPNVRNLEYFEKMLTERITQEKKVKEREANLNLVFQALIERCKYEFDEEKLDLAAEDLYKKFTEELKNVDNMELMTYLIHRGITADELLAECKDEAARRVIRERIIDAVIEKEGISLTADEISYLEERIIDKENNGQIPVQFDDINLLQTQYLRQKARDFLLDNNLKREIF
ncbi:MULTISPECIES: trigger factor [unclassified Dehalobacter]|uniref:trigger factor n=1 Tax=unclassified Dehalobacter TaxID=2635733 RepID=UPI000E6C71C6|nr:MULTISPECIES: trigger factor [unclassified Dehalobacter]RJE48648.1 trigger factor [Dehalobacter sp. MCB1]TCX47270.1 trigger factor [Dehalobacter sp. 14DCB1]TCX55692.1 trigger factor [Dehalobacter sp. 12DCB1]